MDQEIAQVTAPHAYMKNAISGEAYVTPLQRKQQLITSLKKEISKFDMTIDFKERELSAMTMYKDPVLELELTAKNEQVATLTEHLQGIQKEVLKGADGATPEQAELKEKIKSLKKNILKQREDFQTELKDIFRTSKKTQISLHNKEKELNSKIVENEDNMVKLAKIKLAIKHKTKELEKTKETESEIKMKILRKIVTAYGSDEIEDFGNTVKSMVLLLKYDEEKLRPICVAMKNKRDYNSELL